MEKIQERMKELVKFGQKVSAVMFREQVFYIVECGNLQGGTRGSQRDFTLFDDKNQLGYLYLSDIKMSALEIELEKQDGVIVAPEEYFLLTDIEISSREMRCKGLGSMLLNWATKQMQQASAEKGKLLPLLFIRHNSEETFSFYQKWNAVVNQVVEDRKIGSSCYMRIDNPQTKPEYDVKVVAEYEKPITKEDRSK